MGRVHRRESAEETGHAADLLALPESVHAELVASELVETATPTFEHGAAQHQISAQLGSRFDGPPRGGSGGWWFGTEVDVQYASEVFRHDIVGCRSNRHPQRPSGRPIRQRPDWVCEVLSASNASTDTVRKLRTLQSFEVPHDWLADPDERRSRSVCGSVIGRSQVKWWQ
ncbi:MAG: Uma2 family endonuclease [Myxococcaceae bacterium]|nr:Uma2 family endonuclease [Myxococcaceae bacterium]